MLSRLFQPLFIFCIVFFAVVNLPAPAFSGVPGGGVQTGGYSGVSGELTCILHHSAPRLKECEQPYTRRTGQWSTSPSKKHGLAAAALNNALPLHKTGAYRDNLPEQSGILLYHLAGAPYNGHRARTGRQLN